MNKLLCIFIILFPFIIGIYYVIQMAIIPGYKEYIIEFWHVRMEDMFPAILFYAIVSVFIYVFCVVNIIIKNNKNK